MTSEEITAKIEQTQQQLHQVTQNLIAQSPVAQRLVGSLETLNSVLADDQPATNNKAELKEL